MFSTRCEIACESRSQSRGMSPNDCVMAPGSLSLSVRNRREAIAAQAQGPARSPPSIATTHSLQWPRRRQIIINRAVQSRPWSPRSHRTRLYFAPTTGIQPYEYEPSAPVGVATSQWSCHSREVKSQSHADGTSSTTSWDRKAESYAGSSRLRMVNPTELKSLGMHGCAWKPRYGVEDRQLIAYIRQLPQQRNRSRYGHRSSAKRPNPGV